MKVKLYRLLEECIARGICGGIINEDLTANKGWLAEQLTQRVMNEIDEYFTFE